MNTETNTAAQAAETLLAEAVGFANISHASLSRPTRSSPPSCPSAKPR